MIQFQTGDFGFSRLTRPDFISDTIRWVTERRGESRTLCTHSFPFIDDQYVLDAHLGGIDRNEFTTQYEQNPDYEYCVYRLRGLNVADHFRVMAKISSWQKRGYSPIKIGLQFIDGMISKVTGKDVWFARRLGNFTSRYVICSWCTGSAGSILGAWESDWAKMANPDELLDFILDPKNRDRFELVTSSPDFFPSPA